MAKEKLFEIWSRRNPNFETRYEDKIIKIYTDYGKGSSSYQESRGKILGAGYEIYIIAFFIGLYFDRRRPMDKDKLLCKGFGQPIQYWGNKESRGFRKSYAKIREYIFVALVARSEVDFIALDQDKITPRKVVDILIETMEEYANFGFYYMEEKLIDNPDYFYRNSAFLDIFLSFRESESLEDAQEDVEALD